ncbi:type VII secretion protein EccB [Glycomyces algeriensis]|uniref:Type VII secretion protein EccB n=1 Tax=Glycomyces algeriensis TaxID=256037 RepID=A0A9W6G4C8_9ACTN|nr:type VII secretion protein EccB [Glycomyces algeriensis]MDA1366982.1 type VII secretion protein EccB [Glycomyces algeriensis]MDR7352631.1 type VII secretion protein EccB [Glycomyces algeriensis]GLI40311.1 type VII secretion protein EccB [Glycomyces algeriensis]
MPQMRSRREQVEAHKFITSRMNQALVLANPDSIERPLRRIGLSIFVSTMVLALVFGGFAIATLFGKGNAEPVVGNIITIKGSNAVYVYVTKDGKDPTDENPARLWQVTNYTSALLLAKPGANGKPEVQDLKPDSLKGKPRGSFTIGIQGIPSQPPDKEELLANDVDWNTCSMSRVEGGTAEFQLTQLVVEDLPEPSQWLGDDKWILAQTAPKQNDDSEPKYFLLWNGGKYQIGEDATTAQSLIGSLGLQVADAVMLNESMLNTIPSVAPIAPDPRQEFGDVSNVPTTDGGFVTYGAPVQAAGEQYVLVKENGVDAFAPISATMFKLLQSQVDTAQEVEPTTVSTTGNQAVFEPETYPQEDLSDTLWSTNARRPAVCAVYDPADQNDESTNIKVAMYEEAPKTLTENAKSVEVNGDGEIFSTIDNLQAQTVLPQGTATLIDKRADQGATVSGFTFMVSDQGIAHGIVDDGPTDTTQNALGYGGVKPVSVPDTMVSLIPQGPELDPYEAKKQMQLNIEDVPVYETAPEEEGGG